MIAAAPHVLYPPDGPQSVGQVLDAGFRIFKVSLVRCLLYGAMAMIAGQLPNIYSLAAGQPFDSYLRGEPVSIVLAFIGSVITVYLSGVMLIRQREIAQGRRQTTRADLARGLRRLPSLLGVAIVTLLLVSLVPAGFLVGESWFVESRSTALVVGLGILALPIFWVLPGLAMAVAVAVLTESGTVTSLKQGVSLVVGSWWRTIVTFAVWAVLLAVFNFVAVIIIVMAAPVIGATDVATVTAGTPVVFVALRAIGLPFLVAIMLAVHGDLQVRRQGVDLQRRVGEVAQA